MNDVEILWLLVEFGELSDCL